MSILKTTNIGACKYYHIVGSGKYIRDTALRTYKILHQDNFEVAYSEKENGTLFSIPIRVYFNFRYSVKQDNSLFNDIFFVNDEVNNLYKFYIKGNFLKHLLSYSEQDFIKQFECTLVKLWKREIEKRMSLCRRNQINNGVSVIDFIDGVIDGYEHSIGRGDYL